MLLSLAAVALAGCARGDTTTDPTGIAAGLTPTAVSAAERRAIAASNLPPCPQTQDLPEVPAGLPDATLECLGAGPAVSLPGLHGSGQPLVLNVWASWCVPCAAEMPRLVRAADAYAGSVDFLGLNILDDRVAALDWADHLGVNFASLYDHDGVVRTKMPISGPPVTFLVAADGRIVHTEYGEITTDRDLQSLIEQHLGVSR